LRELYDRLKERGKHRKVAEVACMRKLLAIVYGCWSNDERFDPTYEKGLKARQGKSPLATPLASRLRARASTCRPVPWKEEKKRRKATSPVKSVSPSTRVQVVKGPSLKNIVTANLLPSKLDN